MSAFPAFWDNFWWLMAWAVVVWYCTITGYVAVKGVFDIKGMLARLSGNGIEE